MPKRILIAEDDQQTRELLVSYATEKGYDVTSVADGVELLTLADDRHFDVIVTDLLMANLNGSSASSILKLQGNFTPIIALTALSSEDISFLNDNFTKIFHKPCDYSELFDFIELITAPDSNHPGPPVRNYHQLSSN
jgi:DNA-binding response OmpR family regulator